MDCLLTLTFCLTSGDVTTADSNLELSPSPIWCLACRGNLIVAGCGSGKIEVSIFFKSLSYIRDRPTTYKYNSVYII